MAQETGRMLKRNKRETVRAQEAYRTFRRRAKNTARNAKRRAERAERIDHREMEFSEIARRLGISRDMARKTFRSAILKLRSGFAARGITRTDFDEVTL